MNKHTLDGITAALRDLDPAHMTALTDEERDRADAMFTRILAAPTQGQAAEESDRPRRRRSLVWVGLVGAAAAAVPALVLGGGSAFASWTPKPEPLTDATEAATTCRAALQMPDEGERVVIAERRGGWTYVLIAGPTAEGTCLMLDDLVGSQDPADRTEKGFFGTYETEPVEAPPVARDRIVETGSMQGSVRAPGALPFTTDDGWFSWVAGHVGGDVSGVTVHPPIGPDVEASVANGRFAAWWPSDQPDSENLEVMEAWTYTVTLADGTTRRITR